MKRDRYDFLGVTMSELINQLEVAFFSATTSINSPNPTPSGTFALPFGFVLEREPVKYYRC